MSNLIIVPRMHKIRDDVWQHTILHNDKWRDDPDSYWFARLVEEVGELGGSLVGNHDDPPEWELKQIATICMNWLDMRQNASTNDKGE